MEHIETVDDATAAEAAPPTRSSSARRRSDIAAAARALIVERGFEGLRTRAIADRVGINVATLHYHVPTKQALVELVAQSLRDEFAAQHAARPHEGLSPLERLTTKLGNYEEILFEKPDVIQVFAELGSRERRDEAVHAVMERMRTQWRHHFADILRDGRATGDFRPDLDPDNAALMIISALVGVRSHGKQTRDEFHAFLDEIVRAVVSPAAATTLNGSAA